MPTDLHFFAPEAAPLGGPEPSTLNSVFLAGALTEPPEERELAGGVKVVRLTVRVPRGQGKAGTDLIDCFVVDPDLQERALTWPQGQELLLEGAIRRRFFRAGGRTTTRVEVEAHAVTDVATAKLRELTPASPEVAES